MPTVTLSSSKLIDLKKNFEHYLINLNNVKLVVAGKIDLIAKEKLFEHVEAIRFPDGKPPFYPAYEMLGRVIKNKDDSCRIKIDHYKDEEAIFGYEEIGEKAAKKDPICLYNQIKKDYIDILDQIDLLLQKQNVFLEKLLTIPNNKHLADFIDKIDETADKIDETAKNNLRRRIPAQTNFLNRE